METAQRVPNYKLARTAEHKGRACPSIGLNSWVGASAQHMTSHVPTHKDRYLKGGSGLRLIITRLPEHLWLPMELPIQRLTVGKLEWMHQFVE